MLRDIPPVVSLALLLGTVCGVLWVTFEFGRRYSVRGTRRRYVMAGIERAFRYPAGGWLAVSAAVNLTHHLWTDMVVNLAGFAVWLFVLWEKKRDGDDDDFWSEVKKRLGSLFGPRRLASSPAA